MKRGSKVSLRQLVRQNALQTQNSALTKRNKELEDLAYNDALTGASTRVVLRHRLGEEIERANRTKEPLSLLIIDVDLFKLINDTYGHIMGDRVLVAITGVLRLTVRPTDVLARYGGDEFVILLPGVTEKRAAKIAKRISRNLAEVVIPSLDRIVVTLSIGVATYPPMTTAETLLDGADRALYRSKRRGRNRVTRASKCQERY